MERMGTALISTLGVMLLSYFAASPAPPASVGQSNQDRTELSEQIQGSLDHLLTWIEESQTARANAYEKAIDQLSELESKLTKLEKGQKFADSVPDFNELPGFDAGGSDGTSNTPGWEAGTISNSGGGSSGGVSGRAASAFCPCGSNCNCRSVQSIRYQAVSGGSNGGYSGRYSNFQPAAATMFQRIRSRPTVNSQNSSAASRPKIFNGPISQLIRSRSPEPVSSPLMDCSTGTCPLIQ